MKATKELTNQWVVTGSPWSLLSGLCSIIQRSGSYPILEPNLERFSIRKGTCSTLPCVVPLASIILPYTVNWELFIDVTHSSTRSMFAIIVARDKNIHVWNFTYFMWYKSTILWCNIKPILYTNFTDLLLTFLQE